MLSLDFSKKTEIDGNDRQNNLPKMGNPHIKRKNIAKKVRFEDQDQNQNQNQYQNIDGYVSSSSDSDIGTDIDIDSFKESLNTL